MSNPLDLHAEEFAGLRRRLFGIAYRMLGSAADADDVLQDVWVRWQNADRSVVRDPAAFLETTTTRVALNMIQSARHRRESYVGSWLPEPVDTAGDPMLGAERDEPLALGVLLLMEKLAPLERAAYVLREAFDYPHARIADVLAVSETHARQLASRARKHLERERSLAVAPEDHARLLDAFLSAARGGDLASLERLLAPDIVSYSDGGGVVHAARVPVVGKERVAPFLSKVSKWFWDGISLDRIDANGRPALRIARDGIEVAVIAIRASAAGIDRIFWMMNPAKLASVARAARTEDMAPRSEPDPPRHAGASGESA